MVRTLRVVLLGVMFLGLATGSTIAGPFGLDDASASTADQTPADKAAADKAAADKAAADKAAADKAAADKAAADKAAADKAAAANTPMSLNNDQIYSKSLAALTMLFVIALLLESAFAVIFNWRVFLTYFSLRGVKTIVMVVSSLLVVYAFHIDVLASLIAAYKSPQPPSPPIDPASISGPVSLFITALILSGGSAGVNRIMTTLGFRSPRTQDEVAPRPPANRAWIAIRVNRQHAVSEVFVRIREIGPADANSPAPMAGVITFKRAGLSALLFPDANRFPQSGGYTVLPNVVYSICVESKDADGNVVRALDNQNYVLAVGAIVDFLVVL